MPLIDADALRTFLIRAGQFLKMQDDKRTASHAIGKIIEHIDNMPTVDAVPTDFHDNCMQTEIQKRIRLEKIARLLCEGYLDMPSGCDGCPLADTMVEDDEGNGICDLYRR